MSCLLRRLFLSLGLLLAVSARAATPSAGEGAREYQIKAVYLFNFIQFVDWPATAFPSPDSPIEIGVLGRNPFGSSLDEAVKGEKVRGRRLIVHYSERLVELRECHVLFVAASENERLADILARVSSGAVLTVGEMPDFPARGGIINFYPDGKKVRFEINSKAAEQHGLKPSSQLLSLARIVGSPAVGER
jgi:hypothetical protein